MWRHKMLGRKILTVDGERVEIIRPGVRNGDAGPDFLNARLRIGEQEWVGNVEIHVRASDWYRHGHDGDPAYDNVVLHVVAVNDRRVTLSDGRRLPQSVVTFPQGFFAMYARLAAKVGDVPCSDRLGELPSLVVADWIETLSVERMQAKARRILDLCKALGNDWEQTAFVMLARSLGFGLNGDPFEMLARSLPLKVAWHHADNPMQVEALLFGQAGMLDMSVNIFNEYYQTLCREYYFLSRKYSLSPIPSSSWRFARTRPQNFPHRRIAMLATVCCRQVPLFSGVTRRGATASEIRETLSVPLSGYWERNVDFSSGGTGRAPSSLSEASIDLLMINFAAPLLYAYGASVGDPDVVERGMRIWESLRAENNTYVRQWKTVGIPSSNAAHSQALLQLRKEYCDADRCLDCRFGHALLRSEVAPLLESCGKS